MTIKNIRAAVSPVCNMKCRYCSNNNEESYARMEDFRRHPISDGVLTYEQWLGIFKGFYDAGFRGVTLTGGEPTLNQNWMNMLEYCNEIGFINTEITSNLLELEKYKDRLETAKYITKFKVSLDTFDKEKFAYLTGVDGLDRVRDNIQFLCNQGIPVQLNRVTMKSTQSELIDYIKEATKMNVSINLLDLVYYKNGRKDNKIEDWQKEFVTSDDTWEFLNNNLTGLSIIEREPKYGFVTEYNNSRIILKDSRLTKRAEECKNCKLYCQEGIFTVRIASDGTITMCPDYDNELPFIDGVKALNEGNLAEQIRHMREYLDIEEENHFDEYVRRLQGDR